MDYVVGLAISNVRRDEPVILLIRKKRPRWQVGKLNGIGGLVNPPESILEAMCREFEQECGIRTLPQSWEHCVSIYGKNDEPYRIHYFRAFLDLGYAKTTTDEEVLSFDVTAALYRKDLIMDLYWIIPLLVIDRSIHYPVIVQRR